MIKELMMKKYIIIKENHSLEFYKIMKIYILTCIKKTYRKILKACAG